MSPGEGLVEVRGMDRLMAKRSLLGDQNERAIWLDHAAKNHHAIPIRSRQRSAVMVAGEKGQGILLTRTSLFIPLMGMLMHVLANQSSCEEVGDNIGILVVGPAEKAGKQSGHSNPNRCSS